MTLICAELHLFTKHLHVYSIVLTLEVNVLKFLFYFKEIEVPEAKQLA